MSEAERPIAAASESEDRDADEHLRLPPTIGLEEAAQLLRMAPSTLRKRARVGEVPGAKIGRQWVFVRADLIELIREQARKRTGRPINIRALRTANPFERSASQLARQIESERRDLERRRKAPARRTTSK